MTQPRIALVCDWLTTPGGAEKVLLELHHLYPESPIYTSMYRPHKINWFNDATVKTGWLNIFPVSLRKILGPLRQLYFSHLDLSGYDLVISVTGAEAKSVRTTSRDGRHHAYHLCYCHAPTQYYWQAYDQYLENPGFGVFNFLVRFFFRLLVGPLRKADFAAAERPDQIITISHYSASQIKEYYHRDSIIVYPPVNLSQFSTKKSTGNPEFSTVFSKFSTAPFIISCRQVTWKRVDLAILACKHLGLPLLVIGDGSEHNHLVKLAAGDANIQFLPWLSANDLAFCLQKSAAYIFPSLEPFGIAAVEALAAGCPVIAYANGGSRDIVIPGENGLLFSEQTSSSLVAAIRKFQKQRFARRTIAASVKQFGINQFDQGIKQLVQESGHV